MDAETDRGKDIPDAEQLALAVFVRLQRKALKAVVSGLIFAIESCTLAIQGRNDELKLLEPPLASTQFDPNRLPTIEEIEKIVISFKVGPADYTDWKQTLIDVQALLASHLSKKSPDEPWRGE